MGSAALKLPYILPLLAQFCPAGALQSQFRFSIASTTSPHNWKMDTCKRISMRAHLTEVYPFGGPSRLPIPEDKIYWDVKWDYNPPVFTIPGILKGDKPWADPELGVAGFSPKFNELDGKINRKSWEGKYRVSDAGLPLNIMGRTGMGGRGSLGKWGPNHAADCIVTRWKVDGHGKVIVQDELPVIQFVAIRRKDSGDIAIPGGMVEPGEEPLDAAKREFIEEVIGIESMDSIEPELKGDLQKVFDAHKVVDKCYVDDRRNTDNAWIETFAVNFHISQSLNIFNTMKFKSGSDAQEAFWIDYNPDMKLYASHSSLIKKAVAIVRKECKPA